MTDNAFYPNGHTAVVVNDDLTQLRILSGLLNGMGMRVDSYGGASEALEGMTGTTPNIIVTDLYMPEVDGWRFCRLLRSPEYEAFNNIPILVVSATFSGDEAARITADLGANAFLPSPVDGQHFIETVKSLLTGDQPVDCLRVLIVEDSKTLAGLLKQAFEDNGYTVDIALTVEAAKKAFERTSYDAAVIDYHLPDGKGDDLLLYARKNQPGCVCIMMTTDPNPELALKWMRAGSAAYLRKPFDTDYLIELCTRARRERALLRVEDILEERTQSLRNREAELNKHLLYEQCVSDSVRMLSETSESGRSFQQILELMRKTVNADRSYIFLVEDDSGAGKCMTQIHEACAEGVFPQIDNPNLQRLPFETGAPSLLPVLEEKKPFFGIVSRMTGPERDILGDQGILSVLIVPVFVNSYLWGFLGFDDCTTPREWQNEDIRVLQTIAEVMGSTISRSRTTESLEKKTKEQRLLLDTIDTQVWYLADIDTYGQLNLSHAEFLGLDVKTIAHKRLEEFVSKEAAEVFRSSNIEVFRTKKQVQTEEWIPNAEGEKRLIAITKTPKLDTSGNVEYVVCAGTDITERVRMEEALRESEAGVNAILEAFPGMLNAVDKDYNIINASKQLIEKAGYISKKDVLGGKCYSTWKKREKICPECGVKRVLAEKKPLIRRCTAEEAKLTGTQSDLYIAPIIDENGLTTGAVEIMLDISDRLNAEEELRKSQQDLILTLSLIQDLVAIHQNGKIVDINQSGAELLGASSPEQIIGKLVTDFIEPSKTGEADQRIEKLLKHGGRSQAYEKTIIGLDGTRRHVEVIGMPWTYKEQIAIKIVARDISERIRFQAQLQQSQKMEAVGTLAGGVAHDFNNLLQAINGYTQLLLLEKSDRDPDYRSLKAIEKAGFRASVLVRQLLQFSRKADSERNPVDLNQLIGQAKMILERTIPKMVRMETHLDDSLWPIIADEVQIEQILLNLGKNAADAMPDGGKLSIKTENIILDQNYIEKHLEAKAGRYVLLTVSDTGHGIDPETVEHIFDPFFTTKEFGKGTGLGLASVYGIVKSHGGYITCYSEVGQGAAFKIYFPALEQPAVEKTRDADSQAIPHGFETILLVDDEQAIRSFARQAFVKFGYKVLTASTGEEALEIYRSKSNEIDLVITDIGMPGMGGIKFIRELFRIDSNVKVVIASGYALTGQVRQSIEAGARGYIGKPYQLEDLVTTIRTVLDERR